MSRPCYRKDNYIIVENKNKKKTYFTIVNLDTNTHAHCNNFKACKLIIHHARKGNIPNSYSKHMKGCILRLNPNAKSSKKGEE